MGSSCVQVIREKGQMRLERPLGGRGLFVILPECTTPRWIVKFFARGLCGSKNRFADEFPEPKGVGMSRFIVKSVKNRTLLYSKIFLNINCLTVFTPV